MKWNRSHLSVLRDLSSVPTKATRFLKWGRTTFVLFSRKYQPQSSCCLRSCYRRRNGRSGLTACWAKRRPTCLTPFTAWRRTARAGRMAKSAATSSAPRAVAWTAFRAKDSTRAWRALRIKNCARRRNRGKQRRLRRRRRSWRWRSLGFLFLAKRIWQFIVSWNQTYATVQILNECLCFSVWFCLFSHHPHSSVRSPTCTSMKGCALWKCVF